VKQKLQNGVSNGYDSLRVTEPSQEPLGEGTISRDAHEEKAQFHATLVKRKLQNDVSNGHHSLRVTEALQELLEEGTISRDVREEKA
jgi:hypothetical protein